MSEVSTRPKQLRLAAECALLYIGIPLAYAAGLLPIPVILLLVIMAVGCWFAWCRNPTLPRKLPWLPAPPAEWRRVMVIYTLAVPLLLLVLWLTQPSAVFSLLLQRPKLWLIVMLAYPLVSVLPQEFVYRVFFFDRYRELFGNDTGMVIASAAVFSLGHLVFRNWQSVVLTFVGGFLFARTYQRTASLKLVSVEHALYGCALFTLGYGRYFFEGTWHVFQ